MIIDYYIFVDIIFFSEMKQLIMVNACINIVDICIKK